MRVTKPKRWILVAVALLGVLFLAAGPIYALGRQATGAAADSIKRPTDSRVTQEQRQAAADRNAAAGMQTGPDAAAVSAAAIGPGDTPDYFGMPNYANSPLPQVNATPPTPSGLVTSTVFYFAEGTTRPNFDPFICIQNPGGTAANVTITYMKGDATTATETLVVPANSRVTTMPRVTLGTGDDPAHDFSAKVECTNSQQIVAERPMYFNYNGVWNGGHDVIGAVAPASAFYFAEGTTRPNFDPYICIQNPGATAADVTITYMKGDATTATEMVVVPANSRVTTIPRITLGTGDDPAHDFSASVVCTNGQLIVAERPMYFNYNGVWNGGHDVVGATATGTAFYFAEGTTRPNFDPYICIQNPSATAANVLITYMKGNGTIATELLTIPSNSRVTTMPRITLGTGDDPAHDFSVKVECTNGQQIVAERPMYFNYAGIWDGGHDVVGSRVIGSTFFFAEGTARPNFDAYICIQNPGTVAANVTITYQKGDATTATETLVIPASSRVTTIPRVTLGTGDDPAHDFSATVACTNGQQIMVERPMYFSYGAGWTGGHDVVGLPDAASIIPGTLSVTAGTGIRKFIDGLPGLGALNANNLGQYIPVAVPDQTNPAYDYYEIEVGEYTEQLNTDLPATTLRGYRQTNTADATVSVFNYLGPMIIAQEGKPVRVKFINSLPIGTGGDLFIPTDTTLMGAGMAPNGTEFYTQNRATIHLHGGETPWISDGTPYQWITPAGETTSYPEGVSVVPVPDMPDGGPADGSTTFYYTNDQSARLMFYHDHSEGITRLNVYAGEAAPYMIQDAIEKDLIDGTNLSGANPTLASVIPAEQIPLVIQDKTFVPDATQLAWQDPTWDPALWGGKGNLWYPHVYMPNQNPADPGGMNAFARWHYGPWFWPPTTGIAFPPIPNPYVANGPWENATIPATPNPSAVMEAFMDTPVVNGTAYPTTTVQPQAYRMRILNAADDRFFNLQMYLADPTVATPDGRLNTEVKMVPANATPGYPVDWPIDGRAGGVPDPATAGPSWIQIGTEGGFLPAPTVIPNQPIDWNTDPTTFNFGNVTSHSLLLAPAERADVIVDFSQYAGQTLILYNDSPAPFPALDPRYDYYTGAPDLTATGGVPGVVAGYGPNTRTIMQIKVAAAPNAAPYDVAALEAVWAKTATQPGVFASGQDPILVASDSYNSAYNGNFPAADSTYARINNTGLGVSNIPGEIATVFQNISGLPLGINFQPKAIQDEMGEAFDVEYGRMMSFLGLELAGTGAANQNFLLYPYDSPPTDITVDNITADMPTTGDNTQIWRITHNGVDTHPIHVHLFNVQVINRVAWDNNVMGPDPNELGWKETFRVNPLEDTIVALRPYAPVTPFTVPDSIRPVNPSEPVGATLVGPPPVIEWFEPGGQVVTVTNELVNFGWEYVWHCHLLAHEEMDMMHSLPFVPKSPAYIAARTPAAPDGLGAVSAGGVTLTWNDNSTTETHWIVQRAAAGSGVWTTLANVATADRPGTAGTDTYLDTSAVVGTPYDYQVIATNAVGFLPPVPYPAPAIGFPTNQETSAATQLLNFTP